MAQRSSRLFIRLPFCLGRLPWRHDGLAALKAFRELKYDTHCNVRCILEMGIETSGRLRDPGED